MEGGISASRGGKISPIRWVSPVRPKLGLGWAIKLLARKKPGQIWPGPIWPDMARPGQTEFFFALKRLFGPTNSVFRTGWAVKILVRKNRANFGPARFWPGPLLARPNPDRPARLPPLSASKKRDSLMTFHLFQIKYKILFIISYNLECYYYKKLTNILKIGPNRLLQSVISLIVDLSCLGLIRFNRGLTIGSTLKS